MAAASGNRRNKRRMPSHLELTVGDAEVAQVRVSVSISPRSDVNMPGPGVPATMGPRMPSPRASTG